MNISSSRKPQRPATPSSRTAQTEPKDSNTGKLVGAAVIGTGGLALGAGMLFPEKVGSAVDSIKDVIGPTVEAVAPVVGGIAQGAMAGMVTGAAFGGLATMNYHDSTPAFATIGGGMGGLVVGAVAGGVSAAFGATPLVAIPAVIVAGAAFKAFA